MATARCALICGISGQDGAYLAELLIAKGYEVHGTSRDAQSVHFTRLRRLAIRDAITLHSMEITDFRSVLQTLSAIDPDEIYNLAGQSSVGLSFEQPVETLNSIATGTLNVLEVIRFLDRPIRFYNAGSSECFGDTTAEPATENTPFRPRSPYATAKATAHWEVANYRDAYELFACTGILFNHESPLRSRRFVTRKIVSTVCSIARGEANSLMLGNLAIQRDWGWAPEYVEAMWRMLQAETPQDYVICTGETHSLEAFCRAAFEAVGLEMDRYVSVDPDLFRPSEIMVGRGDASKAANELGWRPRVVMPEVVRKMIAAERASATD